MARLQSSFTDTLRSLAAEGLQQSGGHPSEEELLNYTAGELSDQEANRIGSHLALCRSCAQTALDLMTFPQVELREPRLERTSQEEAEDWQIIQGRILSAHTSSQALIGRPRPAVLDPILIRPDRRTFVLKNLAAAAMLVVLFGLSYWLGTLQRLSSPILAVNVHVEDLVPVSASGTRDSVPGGILSIPNGMDRLVLILANEDLRTFPTHHLEMIAGNGIRWDRGDLVRSPDGSFSIELPLASLPATDYRINLFGSGGKRSELLATYRFRIGYTPVR